jgi:hypothetical protein
MDFIEASFVEQEDLTPEVVRQISVLECLLFSFIEHGADLKLIDKMQEELMTSVMVGSPRSLM